MSAIDGNIAVRAYLMTSYFGVHVDATAIQVLVRISR